MTKHQLRQTILDILLRIEADSGYSHLLVNQYIKSRNLDLKDVALLTEVVYGTVQRQLTLDYYLDDFIKPKQKVDLWVRVLLRMSIYQMVYLDRVPDYAIIHEAVDIAKDRGHQGIASFVNGVLRNVQRKGVADVASIHDNVKRLSIETSHPTWLVNRWINNYGTKLTESMCYANLKQKPLTVRVQPLKISREEAIKELNKEDIQAEPSLFSDQGIIIKTGHVLDTQLFANGYITIQDQTSMLASEMLAVSEGMHVLDTCSAPGGKVTHVAELMKDNGSIHAYDLHKNKLKLINKKSSDLQLTIIETKQGDARKLGSLYPDETFDRILVDAPCSGLGVIRSKPDIKYTKSLNDISRLATIQLDILTEVALLLKIGGQIVYSTCTVDVQENEQVVEHFLQEHSNFEVDANFFTNLPSHVQEGPGISQYGLQIFPHSYETDGFFLTRLIRHS